MTDSNKKTRAEKIWIATIIAIPFSAVIVGVVMITVVNWYPDDTVSDDYYKEGLAYNERSVDKNLTTLEDIYRKQGSVIEMKLSSSELEKVRVGLNHVTDSREDVSLEVIIGGDRTVRINDEIFSKILSTSGVWYLEISTMAGNVLINQRIQTPVKLLNETTVSEEPEY